VGGERLGEIDRAMLAAGAADGNGDIAAIIALESRQPVGDEASDVLKHLLGLRIGS
jgi:hypothetical protein